MGAPPGFIFVSSRLRPMRNYQQMEHGAKCPETDHPAGVIRARVDQGLELG